MRTILCLLTCASLLAARAATTINANNRFAYGANIGWIDARADTANGAVIGDFVCSGYMYSANCGWINLGSGAPVNGIRYNNNAAADFGVNHDGTGNLRGYAWGANIGWINFESNGAPRVDLKTGRLSGYAWGANVGWISLSNSFAFVQTDTFSAGPDTDGDGIADAWERLRAGNLTTLAANHDTDGDGMTDLAEYLADTDPLSASSKLRFTSYSISYGGGNQTETFAFTSQPTRCYRIDYTTALQNNPNLNVWVARTGLLSPSGTNTTVVSTIPAAPPMRFYRTVALLPLR